jgi:hypothetical protein
MRRALFFSFLRLLVLFSAVWVHASAQSLVSTGVQGCTGSFQFVLNCTDPKFQPQEACTSYTPDDSVLCEEVPVFYSETNKYQLVFFKSSNPDISAWANGQSILALTAYEPASAASGTGQCSYSDVLASKFVDLTTNATNLGRTVMSSPYGFTWFDGANDTDAGIKVQCLTAPTPPPPPTKSPPPMPPSGDGAVQYVCDETAHVVEIKGCIASLPPYIPPSVCSNYTLTRSYIPYECYGGTPVFQSLTDPSLFIWFVDKNATNGVNDYILIGHGKSLCQFSYGLLTLMLDPTTAGMSWTEKMQSGDTFSFFNETLNSDSDSGAGFNCLTYRIATPPPSLPPPPSPPGDGSGGTRERVKLNESELAGAIAGSCVAVFAALCAAYCTYRTRFAEKRKRVLVRPETSRRFLL